MMEMARLLAKTPPQRSLLFIAFDGGEQNNAGAKFYADHPIEPLEKTAAMISLSGFGGGMSEQLHETLYLIGSEFSPQLREAAGKHKRGEAHLALVGRDVMRWPGGEHFLFTLKQTPTITVTNGVHYAYHSKADTPNRINFAALEKHVAALIKVVAEIANFPGKIELRNEPGYDAEEALEWHRVLTALRENVIKTPANDAAQSQIDNVLLELKRHQNRPVQNPKAREAVILRAANICFYIANPNGVEYNSLLNRARNYEQSGERQQAIAAYQKLLKFIEQEYARDDQTVRELRERLAKLNR
jgi:tetratricopeptide (TPR) repeat protein